MLETRIKDLQFYKAISKLSKPIADATHQLSEISFIIAEVTLESGIKGQGYLLSFHYSPQAIKGALEDLRDKVVGYHCYETVKLQKDIEAEHEYFGHEGIQRSALAIINIAMWDSWGKTLDRPIWQLLGSSCDKVNVYGSGGWLSYSDEELIQEVLDYKKRGFQAVKIKVGAKEEGRDIQRLRKVREALGDHMKIMMDANQGMNLQDALKLAGQSRKFNIHWFEEPLDHRDIDAYRRLREKTDISLAMGEREYSILPLKLLIKERGLDLWQPDIVRIGGVDKWLASAALADAYHIPVLPHYYKDYDVPLICTISNGYGVESFDWIDDIIDNPMKIVDGYAKPRMEAGWGFEFKSKYLTVLS